MSPRRPSFAPPTPASLAVLAACAAFSALWAGLFMAHGVPWFLSISVTSLAVGYLRAFGAPR